MHWTRPLARRLQMVCECLMDFPSACICNGADIPNFSFQGILYVAHLIVVSRMNSMGICDMPMLAILYFVPYHGLNDLLHAWERFHLVAHLAAKVVDDVDRPFRVLWTSE